MLHIGLQPQYILSFFGVSITNTFFTSVVVSCLLVLCALGYYVFRYNSTNGLMKVFRAILSELLRFTDAVTGDRNLSKKAFPLVATLFLFIVTANLLALVPGFLGSFFVQTPAGALPLFKSPNSDLSTTLALALVSVVAIQYFSLQMLGFKKYLGRFFDFSGPIAAMLGFFALLSESVKLISFSFRLFGNIFAGEVLLLVVAFLVPYVLPLPFMALELFVGVIQAFIFAVLTLAFIRSSSLPALGS